MLCTTCGVERQVGRNVYHCCCQVVVICTISHRYNGRRTTAMRCAGDHHGQFCGGAVLERGTTDLQKFRRAGVYTEGQLAQKKSYCVQELYLVYDKAVLVTCATNIASACSGGYMEPIISGDVAISVKHERNPLAGAKKILRRHYFSQSYQGMLKFSFRSLRQAATFLRTRN